VQLGISRYTYSNAYNIISWSIVFLAFFSIFNYVGDNKATTLYSRDIRYFLLLCLFIKQIKCVQGITSYIWNCCSYLRMEFKLMYLLSIALVLDWRVSHPHTPPPLKFRPWTQRNQILEWKAKRNWRLTSFSSVIPMELQACWTMCWESWLIAYRQRKLQICTKYKIILEQSEFQAVVGQSCRDSKF
jgi:hypothetical protein